MKRASEARKACLYCEAVDSWHKLLHEVHERGACASHRSPECPEEQAIHLRK